MLVGWKAAEKEELERLGFTVKIYRPRLGGWRGANEPSSEQQFGWWIGGLYRGCSLKVVAFLTRKIIHFHWNLKALSF